MNSLPRQLRLMRDAKGITQKELAAEFGKSPKWVADLESGRTRLNPTLFDALVDCVENFPDLTSRGPRYAPKRDRALYNSVDEPLFQGPARYLHDHLSPKGSWFVHGITYRIYTSEDHARRSCGEGLIAKYYELSTERGAHGAPTFHFGTSTYREVRRTVL